MEPVPNVSVHNENCYTLTENKCRRCSPYARKLVTLRMGLKLVVPLIQVA